LTATVSMRNAERIKNLLLLACLVAALFPPPAHAADLKPETVRAYDHYVHLLEMRMDEDLHNGNFLYIDRLPGDTRAQIYDQIRRGDPYIQPLDIMGDDSPVPIPSGLIHHWVGISFIPGATYPQTLKILLDFDKQAEIYKPEVQKSKLLERDGNKSKVYLQYLKKSLVTVVLNANFVSEYLPMGVSRGEIRSYSTHIAEVQNAGEPDERELPAGMDHGYLWRLNSYWKLEEKDGGVYLQIESVALSRRVPVLIAWLINPIVRNLSRAVIRNLLASTCRAVNHDPTGGRDAAASAAQSCVLLPGS
jgi:hypothetical protein